MKFVCLGCLDENSWNEMPEGDRKSFLERCFAYDDELRSGGHYLGGEALQSARNGVTVRWRKGQIVVTDGPYAETKEQLGGILATRDKALAVLTPEQVTTYKEMRGAPFDIKIEEFDPGRGRDQGKRDRQTD
jgi:hypothetical protein